MKPTLSYLITQLRKRGDVAMFTTGRIWKVVITLKGRMGHHHTSAVTLQAALRKALESVRGK